MRGCIIDVCAKMPLRASIFAYSRIYAVRLRGKSLALASIAAEFQRKEMIPIVNERLIAEIGARAKSNSHRIERLEEIACEIHKQNENIAKMVAQMEFMNKELTIHDARLSEIESRPQKRLGSIITSIITAVCGALFGGLVTALIKFI